jgi:glutamate/tyrosine decarboxylase-like PLP-dependent enzyme
VAKPCILTSTKCDFSLEKSVIVLGVKADAS